MIAAEYLDHTARLPASARCAFALPPRTRITVRGPDALRFLNGQSSNQMSNTAPDRAIASCLLTIKGRVICVPVCWRGPDALEFILEVPAEVGETTIERLDRYLIADDAELAHCEAPATWHLPGPLWQDNPPDGARAYSRFGLPGFDWDGPQAPAGTERVLSDDEALALRILGRVAAEGEFAAGVFPAEVGLDRSAVDFHKGCYLGQEVVSRLESVGRARRVLVNWISAGVPAAGSDLLDSASGRVIGTITSVLALHEDGTSCAAGLAVVREELAKPGNSLHAASQSIPDQPAPIQIYS